MKELAKKEKNSIEKEKKKASTVIKKILIQMNYNKKILLFCIHCTFIKICVRFVDP